MNNELETKKKAHIKPEMKIICMEPSRILASSAAGVPGGPLLGIGGTGDSFD